MRQVIIYSGEDGYWVAECTSLPGCVSQGKTKEEALKNIKDAIQVYIVALEQDNLPVPPETFEAMVGSGLTGLPVVSGQSTLSLPQLQCHSHNVL